MAFQGYTQQTVDFMWGIRFNNERGWFLEHKDDYINTFLTPTRELGEQVYDAVHALLPDEPLMLKVSRIYRDARRLFGRGPYKDHLWWCIRTGDKDWTGRPTFWFELGPDYYSFGLGFWSPAAAGRRGVYGGISPLPVPREPFPSLFRPGDRPRPAVGTG